MTAKHKQKPKGRPSAYTPELAAEICDRMAAGETLRQVCRDERLPDERTVRRWAMDDVNGFSPQYARARECLVEHWADEIVDIADDASGDTIVDPETKNERADSEWINRSRLRVDARKWLLSKLMPRQYGDKVELSGNKDAPVTVEIVRFTKPE